MLRRFVDRLLCRLLGKHDWVMAFGRNGFEGWFCFWCGHERDASEVEQ